MVDPRSVLSDTNGRWPEAERRDTVERVRLHLGEKKITTHGVRLLDKRGGENISAGTGRKQSSGWYNCLVFQDDFLWWPLLSWHWEVKSVWEHHGRRLGEHGRVGSSIAGRYAGVRTEGSDGQHRRSWTCEVNQPPALGGSSWRPTYREGRWVQPVSGAHGLSDATMERKHTWECNIRPQAWPPHPVWNLSRIRKKWREKRAEGWAGPLRPKDPLWVIK